MTGLMYIALHLVGDFVLQSDWMAENKRSNKLALITHCSVYTAPFAIMWWLKGGISIRHVFLIWISHFLIDRRRWGEKSSWEHKPILIDQTLHFLILAYIEFKVNHYDKENSYKYKC